MIEVLHLYYSAREDCWLLQGRSSCNYSGTGTRWREEEGTPQSVCTCTFHRCETNCVASTLFFSSTLCRFFFPLPDASSHRIRSTLSAQSMVLPSSSPRPGTGDGGLGRISIAEWRPARDGHVQRASSPQLGCLFVDRPCCNANPSSSQSASPEQANTGKMQLTRAVLEASHRPGPQRLHRRAAIRRNKSQCGDGLGFV